MPRNLCVNRTPPVHAAPHHPDKSIMVSGTGKKAALPHLPPKVLWVLNPQVITDRTGTEPTNDRPRVLETFPCYRAHRACKGALKPTKKFLFQNDILEVMYNCFLSVPCLPRPPRPPPPFSHSPFTNERVFLFPCLFQFETWH